VAGGLRARGVRRGDLIALLFPNAGWLDYGCALLGVLSAGAAAVVVSDGGTDDELRHTARSCELRAVLTGRPRELPGIAGWQAGLAEISADASPRASAGSWPPACPCVLRNRWRDPSRGHNRTDGRI
jgi:acyl-CoA synthetase (AMP-forming)/AMP-acid ligase II